ncbi:hypothetical protein KQI84_18630 [bacterium]|nr:hypothetical protein [bacterium]
MASSEERSAPSGRKVLILLFLATVFGVGILLTGPARMDQVCVHCLEQRHGTTFRIGSFDVGAPKWTADNSWPGDNRYTPYLPEPFATPLADSPRAYHEAIFDTPCDHRWETTARTMPFALVVQIPNRQALQPDPAGLVNARRIAMAVLDPSNEEDRECFRHFDEVLRTRKPGEEPRRRRRHPVTQPGEEAASAFMVHFSEVVEKETATQDVRAAACDLSIEEP